MSLAISSWVFDKAVYNPGDLITLTVSYTSTDVLPANALTHAVTVMLSDATGTATWFRWVTSGAAFCFDGSISTSGSDLNLTTTAIVATQPVSVTSWTITEGNP